MSQDLSQCGCSDRKHNARIVLGGKRWPGPESTIGRMGATRNQGS